MENIQQWDQNRQATSIWFADSDRINAGRSEVICGAVWCLHSGEHTWGAHNSQPKLRCFRCSHFYGAGMWKQLMLAQMLFLYPGGFRNFVPIFSVETDQATRRGQHDHWSMNVFFPNFFGETVYLFPHFQKDQKEILCCKPILLEASLEQIKDNTASWQRRVLWRCQGFCTRLGALRNTRNTVETVAGSRRSAWADWCVYLCRAP